MPVHDGGEVEESIAQANVGDVRRPDLIYPRDGNVSQQIGEHSVFLIPLRQSGSGVDRLEPHQPHQPLHPLSIHDELVGPLHFHQHPPAPIERSGCVDPVDHIHDLEVLLAFWNGFVVVARPANPQQFALSDDAQFTMVGVNESPSFLKR